MHFKVISNKIKLPTLVIKIPFSYKKQKSIQANLSKRKLTTFALFENLSAGGMEFSLISAELSDSLSLALSSLLSVLICLLGHCK